MKRTLLAILGLLTAIAARGGEPLFVPVKIDGPVHDPANHTYWFGPFSECCSVADFNRDGKLDIAAGRHWYEAPDWKKHENFRDGAEVNGPETDNNSEFALDVNNDGWPDVVSSGWMRMKGAFWYENPGRAGLKAGVKWKAHRLHTAKSMEGIVHGNIMGRDDKDILCNHWTLEPGQGMTWLEHIDRAPWYSAEQNHNPPPNGAVSMGMKVQIVDMDQDGRNDVVVPGKAGLYVFYNVAEVPRGKQPIRLKLEETYPSWTPWVETPLPEAAPIPRKVHGAGPAPAKRDETSRRVNPAPVDAGWTTLFDGTHLDAWQMGPDRSWAIENGVIALVRKEWDGKEHNRDYLWTKKPYGDFILELEFKIPEQANSGVFLRTADLNDPVFTGIEVQVANSFNRPSLSRTGTAGAIYDCLAPTKNAIKAPGEWNRYRITCQGNRIAIVLNGESIVDMDLDQWTESQKNPDGSQNKFPQALKNFARKGHIGLQDHGRAVWYRNIRVKEL